MKSICFLLVAVAMATGTAAAQTTPPFWDEIQTFKKQDSIQPPPQHPILFVGSSSFRLWSDVQERFPGYTILNRGFGGAKLPDVIRYVDDIIIPYHPKQVVIYCGENDVADGDDVTATMVLTNFKQLFSQIRQKLGDVPVAFVSMKPSPSRQKFWPVIKEANTLIRNFLKSQPATAYVDVFSLMLEKNGQPMRQLFTDDMLHMNSSGYTIWQGAIAPHLVK